MLRGFNLTSTKLTNRRHGKTSNGHDITNGELIVHISPNHKGSRGRDTRITREGLPEDTGLRIV